MRQDEAASGCIGGGLHAGLGHPLAVQSLCVHRGWALIKHFLHRMVVLFRTFFLQIKHLVDRRSAHTWQSDVKGGVACLVPQSTSVPHLPQAWGSRFSPSQLHGRASVFSAQTKMGLSQCVLSSEEGQCIWACQGVTQHGPPWVRWRPAPVPSSSRIATRMNECHCQDHMLQGMDTLSPIETNRSARASPPCVTVFISSGVIVFAPSARCCSSKCRKGPKESDSHFDLRNASTVSAMVTDPSGDQEDMLIEAPSVNRVNMASIQVMFSSGLGMGFSFQPF